MVFQSVSRPVTFPLWLATYPKSIPGRPNRNKNDLKREGEMMMVWTAEAPAFVPRVLRAPLIGRDNHPYQKMFDWRKCSFGNISFNNVITFTIIWTRHKQLKTGKDSGWTGRGTSFGKSKGRQALAFCPSSILAFLHAFLETSCFLKIQNGRHFFPTSTVWCVYVQSISWHDAA